MGEHRTRNIADALNCRGTNVASEVVRRNISHGAVACLLHGQVFHQHNSERESYGKTGASVLLVNTINPEILESGMAENG